MSSVLFCTPCYGAMAHAAHMGSCINLKEELTKIGLAHDWLIGTNESLVHRGRMEMTATFLKTEHSHMFWLDADIEFTPEHVAAVWNMDADIGVGVYAMKKRDACWFSAWKDGKLIKDLDQFSEPIKVDYAGTGFMLIKRATIEKLYEVLKARHAIAHKLRKKMGDLHGLERRIAAEMVGATAPDYEGPNGRVPALYMTPIYNDILESEDYRFCRLARSAGYDIMMDTSVRLKHWGQYAYGA